MTIREFSVLGLLELGKRFKQAVKESLTAWLVKLWDAGTGGVTLSAVEAEKRRNVSTGPPLSHKLHSLRQSMGTQSLMDWLSQWRHLSHHQWRALTI